MSSIDTLRTLLVEQLKDIYDAEKRLTKAIPKLVKKATSEDLSAALEDHLAETEAQVHRIEQAFEALGEPPKGKACAGMQGIIEEGNEHVSEDYEDDSLRDAVIIGSAQRVEHYEMAAYGTALAHARLLGLADVVSLLEATLEEEKAADAKLTEIAEGIVNPEAMTGDADDDGATAHGRANGRGANGKDRKGAPVKASGKSAGRSSNATASGRAQRAR